MKTKTKKTDYLEMLLMIIVTVGPISQVIKIIVCSLLIIMNLLFGGLNQTRTNHNNKSTLFAIFIICFMAVAMIFDLRNISSANPYSFASFAYLFPFLVALFYIKKYPLYKFGAIYEKVSFFLCVISLIGFALIVLRPSLFTHFPSIYYYERKLYTIGIYNAMHDWTDVGMLGRNCGCAYEPGAFQFVLSLGLAFVYLNKKSFSKRSFVVRIIFYSLGILSTMSTTGIVILGLLFIFNSVKDKKTFFATIVVVAILGALIISSYKYQLSKMDTGNFESRFGNTRYVITNYWNNFLGVGSTGYNSIYASNEKIGSWDLYSNLFLRFGYPFLILFLFGVIRTRKISFSIMLVLLLTFLTEPLVGPITVCLIYYGIDLNNQAIKKRSLSNESVVGLQCS